MKNQQKRTKRKKECVKVPRVVFVLLRLPDLFSEILPQHFEGLLRVHLFFLSCIPLPSFVLANGSTCDPVCVQMSSFMALPEDVLAPIVMCFSTLDLLAVAATNKTLRDMSAEHLTAAQKAVQTFKTACLMPAYSLRQWALLTVLDLKFACRVARWLWACSSKSERPLQLYLYQVRYYYL